MQDDDGEKWDRSFMNMKSHKGDEDFLCLVSYLLGKRPWGSQMTRMILDNQRQQGAEDDTG